MKDKDPLHQVLYKKNNDEESGNDWLITFSDLISLLLGFFIILFAVSNVDTEKYEEIYQSISKVMGKDVNINEIPPEEADSAVRKLTSLSYRNLKREIQSQIRQYALEDDVSVSKTNRGIEITASGGLLFASGSAALNKDAKSFLDSISSLFYKTRYYITVEGHTDDIPIKSSKYPSNWELAAARATSVVRYLIENAVSPERLTAVSYAHTRPLEHITDEAHQIGLKKAIRAKNRRVVLVISKHSHYKR